MTEKLKELSQNYDKLLINLDQINHPDLFKKLQIIDRMVTDVNIAIEDLNFEVLGEKKKTFTLNEEEQREFDDMLIANNTIKAFSPYIMWFNIYQRLMKDIKSNNKTGEK